MMKTNPIDVAIAVIERLMGDNNLPDLALSHRLLVAIAGPVDPGPVASRMVILPRLSRARKTKPVAAELPQGDPPPMHRRDVPEWEMRAVIACKTCWFARPNAGSDCGYECTVEKARDCSPFGASRWYQRKPS